MLTNSNRRDEKDFSGILENLALNRTFVVLIQWRLFYQDFFEAKRPDLFRNISGNYESKKTARLSKFSPLPLHCVRSLRIRFFSGPYFPAFEPNTERYGELTHFWPISLFHTP